MKKICILQNSMTYGGTDTFVINLCKGLVRDNYEVTVVLSVNKEQILPREDDLIETGAKIVKTCALNSVKSKLKHLKLLFKELKKEKYDAFQSNIDLFNGPQMLVAWLAGVPVRECHSHNSQQGRELSQGRTVPIRFYQGVMRWLCWTFSNRRCGCSEIAMDFLFKKRWKNDLHSKVVYNGIDFSAYSNYLDLQVKKKELGISKRWNVCTVGRMTYQKNSFFIVEIMKSLLNIRKDCDFIWVGTGELKDEIQNKIEEYGIEDNVHLLGVREDVPDILRSCDIFLLPSIFEGLAIVLIEAQAAGLQCVVSNTTAVESNCGGCLYLPLEESADYWANKICEILDGKIKVNVKNDILNNFSVDHMVNEMEEILSNE